MRGKPRLAELPAEFAVFPLAGALLLPHGKLPLNVFEPRYLAMVDDALAGERLIGMVQPDESKPATAAGPALYRIGCLGRLVSFSETDDGRYLITLTGLIRFAWDAELEGRHGYRRVRAALAGFAADLRLEADGAVPRDTLLDALRAYFEARGFGANWDAINQMGDLELVNTLSMVCPFTSPEKQALLEADAPGRRAETLLALLQMDAHAGDGAPTHPVS